MQASRMQASLEQFLSTGVQEVPLVVVGKTGEGRIKRRERGGERQGGDQAIAGGL